ncbi:uncharacterized protein LOC144713827 [Wolffia australiana]
MEVTVNSPPPQLPSSSTHPPSQPSSSSSSTHRQSQPSLSSSTNPPSQPSLSSSTDPPSEPSSSSLTNPSSSSLTKPPSQPSSSLSLTHPSSQPLLSSSTDPPSQPSSSSLTNPSSSLLTEPPSQPSSSLSSTQLPSQPSSSSLAHPSSSLLTDPPSQPSLSSSTEPPFQPSSSLSSTKPPSQPSSSSLTQPSSSTYIVQVPKDQIFRVPPPQNANLAEQYKNSRAGSKQWFHNLRQKCIYAVIISVVSFIIAAVSFYLAVRPALPVFFVESLQANSHRRSSLEMHHVVSLRVRNPSRSVRISYERGGTGVLLDEKGDKAVGNMPGFYQVSGDSKTLFLNFSGQAMHGLSFSIVMKLRLKMKVGAVETSPIQVSIFCQFHLSSVGNSKALLQSCRSVLYGLVML